ncbi:MAG: peptidoglycan DD-metalloendopeptidase family protein [Deltaproteobacteria bacterium]|nr:peptidoglycan DD-metalloendopeptidase family protein [Deltaproteobacteria bacterium]
MRKAIIAKIRKAAVFSSFLVFVIFLFSANEVSANKASADRDHIKIIESNLSREKQKFEKFDSREKDLLSQVSELELGVAERRRVLDKLRKKLRVSRNEIGKLEKKQARLEQSLNDTDIKAAKRLVSLYKYARKGYVKILADVTDMDQFWQRVIYLKAISEEDQKELARLAEEGLQYKKTIARVRRQIDMKESVEKEENARLAALREDLEKKVIRLIRIHKEKEFYETAVKELQIAAQDLKQTFSNIEKKETYSTIWSSNFADARHKLPFPLEGKVIKGNKLLGPANLSFDKGVFIEGLLAEVKAIFPGRVDFSGQLKGYGEVVIINHGSRFFTISARLSQRIKEEGDVVDSGDVIGLAGKNGSLKKTRLYFEIRRAGKSLDPLSWLKKH